MIINGRDTRQNNKTTQKDLSYYQSLTPKNQETTEERMKRLWREDSASTSAVSAPTFAENKSEKSTNPSDLLKRVTVVDNQTLRKTMAVNDLEKQIKQKEDEYVKANNAKDWGQGNQTKAKLSQELSTMREELATKKAELNTHKNDRLLTQSQVDEYNKNAPLIQKIDKAIKNDIPVAAEKAVRTGADLVGNVSTGAIRGLEGYVDAGIGVGGTVLSGATNLVGQKELAKNIKDKAESIVKYGFANDMQKFVDEVSNEGAGIYKPSILGLDMRDAAQEIARMYTVAYTGGLPGLMVSAAGGNIEEALNEGQSLERATAYGAISGSIEGATEKMFDAANILGGGTIKKFANTFFGKIAEATAGEGIEEGVSQALNPFIKMLTYEGEVENPFGSWENFKNYLRDIGTAMSQGAIIGGLTLGVSAPGNVELQKSFSNDVYKAVDKIQGIDQVKKNEIASTILEGVKSVTGEDIKNIRKYVDNYRNTSEFSQYIPRNSNLAIQREKATGLSKLNVQNQVHTQNIQQSNDANINFNEFGKQVDDLISGKRNRKDSLVVLPNTPKIIQKLGAKDLPITVTSSKLERIMNAEGKQSKQYHDLGIDLVKQLPEALEKPLNILKSHDNSYVVVTELADKQDRPIIASIKIDGTGKLDNLEILSNVMTSAYGRNNYDSYMQRNIKEGNLVYDIDDGIIKENLNDGAGLQLSRTTNKVSNNSIPQNENTVNVEYAQNTSNDTADEQSAFSMPEKYISPLTDLQSATDFVKSATVKDVDTLQKMVDEAEKYPNRVDLQFFADEARKRIKYLTKSQRYQRSKISNLIDNLVKSYGIDKSETKKAISEYTKEYNSNGDSEILKKKLLKQLSNGGVLNGQPLTEIANMIDEFNRDLDTVKRYEVDRAQKKQENVDYQLNYDTVSKLYELKKDYQKTADKAMQSTLLTKSDTVQLDRLLKGEITLDELPKNVNRNEIEKAYEVKKPLEDVKKEIQNYNKVIKQRRNEKMRDLVSNSANWKDKKSGLAYARETQERNIADIAPQEEARRINKELFEPVHRNEAQATRYKNDVRDKIKELNIELKPKYEVTYNDAQGVKTEKVSESGLVQLYGEGKINDDILKELGVDVDKIKRSVETFRAIYNDLYSKTNRVLVQNGYAPVEFRKDYFPHFEETKPDTLIGKALAKLGFKIDTRELPTDIAGLTHTFRPGKKWVSNFLQRTTDVATYDAIKGLDSYLDGVADVIYHTEDIQNLRAFENALRYQHSEEAIKEQIDEIMDSDVAPEMKQSMIDQVYADAENSLAHYVTDLRAYTDNLAGKKALEDRTMEHNLGRGIYNITKNVQSRVSANMVGANISSALTNFIPLTQATAVIDTSNLLQATYDTVKNSIKNDGFVEQSDFLVNRRGSDKLYKTAVDKLAGATNLMSLFDNITSEIINRGRYYQNVSNGMSEADARIEADQMSANIMADRSKGSMPTLFNQSSPVTKLLTAFQLEVNNQYSYLLKDIPKEYKDKVVGNLIWAFAKMFIGAWLYNELYAKMTGRRAALDPINIVTETVGDVVDGKKASEVVSGLATEIAEDVPFVGGLINGGRLPISSAIPDIPEVAKAGFSLFEDGDKKKAWGTLGSELSKPVFYILPPFGGGQLKKSIEGISTYVQGGNYGVNSKGEETLKYPVEQTPMKLIKSALFGKWSTNGAVDYVDNGFKPLSVKQTEAYKKALDVGITSEQFYAAYNAQKKIKDLGDLTSLAKKNEIDKAIRGMSKEKREMLYETFGVSKSEWNNTKILFPYEIEKKKQEIAKQKLKKKNDK